MDSRGFYYSIGSFLLVVLLSQCCHHIANSQISPTFKGLECSCGEDCTYGVQDCHLIRCACPYEPDKYNSMTCLDDLCPQNCCELIPHELRNHTATHFMFHEKYENNKNESIQTFQIFTKLNGSANARWVRTVLQQLPQLNYIYLAESVSAQGIDEKLDRGMTDSFDNEAEAPDKVFGVTLDSVDVSKGFSVPLQCHDGLNTSCESEFCSCLKFSASNNSIPEITLLKNITGGNIVFDIGNDKATVSTSSSLTPYHSIDVTKRPTDTIGGWAPFFNDSSPWVEFSNIQENVCGLVVQGVDWAISRRLDKFEVKVGERIVQSQDGRSHFLSGMVLNSKNFHLFSTPEEKPNSLRINVLKPHNRLNVGFRASLITCGDATNILQESCANSLAEGTEEEVEKILEESSQDPTLLNGKDRVALVGNIYHTLKTFLDRNYNNFSFPEGSRITVVDDIAEIDVYFVKLDDLQKTGYSFNRSETKNISDDSSGYTSVYIPAHGFSTDDNISEVVIVTSVVDGGVTENTEEKTRSDEYGYQYAIVSPVVTVSVFVDGVGLEAKQIIKEIEVKVPFKNTTTNPEPFYFEEEEASKSNGMSIQWSTLECNSTCYDLYCVTTCYHATSFAVLQLLGQSKLSQLGRLVSSILTTIGCVVSILSLMAALVIYSILRSSIASAQYAIHSNLMISLLIALCIFMMLLIKEKSRAMCEVIKFLLQYFFSAAFCWMLCEGIHLYRQVVTVFASGSKHLWVYFLIGWAVPLLFVVISITGSTLQRIESPLHTNSTCFFSYRDGSIWYFVAPVLVVMLINTGILLRVILVVIKAAKIQAEKNSSEKAYQAKAGLRSALLLVPLLGCSYIIGFFVSFSGAFEFTYNIINSLQGFFIALLYCALNKEIRTAIGKYIKRSREQSTIQASTTGSTIPKSWSGPMAKNITSSRNQVAPEPIKKVHLEDVD